MCFQHGRRLWLLVSLKNTSLVGLHAPVGVKFLRENLGIPIPRAISTVHKHLYWLLKLKPSSLLQLCVGHGLVWFSIAVMNTITENKLGEKGFFVLYIPGHILYLRKEQGGRNWSRGYSIMLLPCFLSMASSASFLIQPRTMCLEMVPPQCTGPTTSVINQENVPKACLEVNMIDAVP